MGRIKIELPASFPFSTIIPVRITDINYGGHAGNDTILSLIHEARMQYLQNAGYSEISFAGAGLIMADVGIEFKAEVFYGDSIIASLAPGDFSKISFDIYYKLEKESNGQRKLVANAKTGMVCYDYTQKKITAIPDGVEARLRGG